MPYADPATVATAINTLTNGTFAQRKTLLTSNPFLPPSGGINYLTVNAAATGFNDVVRLDYSKLKIGAAADSIAFIKLRPNEKNEVGAITFTLKTAAQLPTLADRVGWIAVWWLPWQAEHIVKIKIRSVVTDPTINCGVGVANVNNPPIFFTAAINGCSVFAVGASTNPSMYHGGTTGMTVRGANELTEDAWYRLLGRAGTAKNLQFVGKYDYISELKPQAQWANPLAPVDTDRTLFETSASRSFANTLSWRGDLTNISVIPFGMVFGLRDAANNWEMTLVKNAFVKYQKIRTQKRMFRSPKTTLLGETRTDRTYDADGNMVNPVIVNHQEIQNCHVLGHQVFFPGAGAAQMNVPGNIAVF